MAIDPPGPIRPAWLAVRALQFGEDASAIQTYLSEVEGRLAPFREGSAISADMEREIQELRMFLAYVVEALRPEGGTRTVLKAGKRRGRPKTSLRAALDVWAAAERVDARVQAGEKQEAALAEVRDETGFSRTKLMEYLARLRRSPRNVGRLSK